MLAPSKHGAPIRGRSTEIEVLTGLLDDVLNFVARRLESDPIVLLAAAREGYPTVFTGGELPELRLEPLDPASATRVLEESGDSLSAGERSRVLRVAAGNPLALVELPL